MCSFELPTRRLEAEAYSLECGPALRDRTPKMGPEQEHFPRLKASVVAAVLRRLAIVAPTRLDVERHKVGRIS
jgi:hypothetical protein